jgi:hypothetical protein
MPTSPRKKKAMSTIEFGGVTIVAPTPTPTEVKRRVAESHLMIDRLIKAIAKPGIKLSHKKSTPVFVADSTNPKLVIRKLDGQETRGEFQNGVFVAVR